VIVQGPRRQSHATGGEKLRKTGRETRLSVRKRGNTKRPKKREEKVRGESREKRLLEAGSKEFSESATVDVLMTTK